MKGIYQFNFGTWDSEIFFFPIRNKLDIIKILMKTLKLMIVNMKVNDDNAGGEISLIVSDMSRLFYFSENKYFSMNFPFTVTKKDNDYEFSSKNMINVDSEITSKVLTIINDEESFNSTCVYQFIEPILKITDSDDRFWSFFKDLLLYEDGYIRYDYDEEHLNDKHPLTHYDVFYSPSTTFKIGLRDKINNKVIIDLLNLGTYCHFIDSFGSSS